MSALGDWVVAGNSFAARWWAWLLERTLVSGVVCVQVLVVLLVGAAVARLLRRAPSAHLPSHLLLLPLLVLFVPVEKWLPVGFPRPLPALVEAPAEVAGETVLAAAVAPLAAPSHATAGNRIDAAAAPRRSSTVPMPSWHALLMLAWCGAIAVAVARLVRRQRRAERALRAASRPAPDRLLRRFRRLAHEARVEHLAPRLRLAAGLPSPLVAGLRAPVVYLPSELADELLPSQVAFVLRHELEHVRRRDVLVDAICWLCRAAFWFHPMVWLSCALHARFRECACDEAALSRANGRRAELAETLLALAERTRALPARAPACPSLLSPRKFMKYRLLRILDSRGAPRARMSIATAALLAVVATGALTAARPGLSPAAAPQGVEPGPVGTALTEASRWLLQQQRPDGSFPIGADPAGLNQRDHNETCVTAMAVLALLPGLRSEPLAIARSLRSAAAFLEQAQVESGRIGPKDPMAMHYAHAYALRALCALQREWPEPARLAVIEKGVEYALDARNPYSGWRYGIRDGDSDSKITGMMLLALRDASALGATVPDSALTLPEQLLEQLSDGETGRTGFVGRGQTMSRFTSKSAHFPGELSEEPTALRLLTRLAAGAAVPSDETEQKGVALVAALPPEWNPDKGSIDLAYWCFGAQLMAAVGGERADRWRAALHEALLPNRVVVDGAAHWPAVDAWSHPGMEVYTTCAAMLALRAFE